MKNILRGDRGRKLAQHGDLPEAKPIDVVEDLSVKAFEHKDGVGIDRNELGDNAAPVALDGRISIAAQKIGGVHLLHKLKPGLNPVRPAKDLA